MKTVFALFTLSSLLLFSGTVLARKDPGDYRKNVIEIESMSEVLQILVNGKLRNNGDNFVKHLDKDNMRGSDDQPKDKDLHVDKWSNSLIVYGGHDRPQIGNSELKEKSSNKDLNVDNWSNSAILYWGYDRPQTGNTDELKDKSSNDNLNHFAPKNKDLNVDKWSNSAILYWGYDRPQI